MSKPIDIPPNERICQFCEQFVVKESYEYSEYTSESFSMSCNKGYFYMCEAGAEEQAVNILKARTCPDFSINPKIIEDLEKDKVRVR